MERKFKISVVMCTYNGEKYLQEQLDSIERQTILPDELVICDDGSCDNTEEIVNSFSMKTKISILWNQNVENLGTTRNFEKACKLSNGDVVFFADQDDYWHEKKVEEIVDVFSKRNDIELVFTDANCFGDNIYAMDKNDTLWSRVNFNCKRQKQLKFNPGYVVLQYWFVTGATMACRRSLLDFSYPFPKGMLHDQWLSLIASDRKSIFALPKKLTSYRIHAGQQTGATVSNTRTSIKSRASSNLALQIYLENINLIDTTKLSQETISLLESKIRYLNKRIKMYDKNVFSSLFYGLGIGYRYWGNGYKNYFLQYLKDCLCRR